MPGRRGRRVVIGACLACGLLGATRFAEGASRTWTNSVGGFFNSSANWGGQSVPAASDVAIFNLTTNYTVAFDVSPNNDRLLFDDGTVTFNLAGPRTYTLGSTSNTSMIVGASLFATPTAALTLIGGGTLSATSASVGNDSGIHGLGLGQVNVTGTNTTWSVSGVMTVGDNARGIVNVNTGGDVRGSITEIGMSSAGTVSVSGAGSTWTNTNWMDVGANTVGTLLINTGGQVSDLRGSVGASTGISGVATVTGAGSKWVHSSDLRVGELGSGSLTISVGGTVQQTNANAVGYIGDQNGSSGSVFMDGGTWTNIFGELRVGNQGSGALNITNGSVVSNNNGDGNIAYSGLSTGVVTVGGVGTGSAWSVRSLYVGGSAAGQGGNGTLSVNAGGSVVAGNADLVKVYPAGTINLTGGTLTTGSLQLVSGARFNWTTGTLSITNAPLSVDSAGMLGASISLSTGKTLSAADLRVGSSGSGSISISGGGLLSANALSIGFGSHRNGTISLTGTTSAMLATDLSIGAAGNGTLSIVASKVVSPSNNATGLNAGSTSGALGRIIVDGSSALWDISAANASPGDLYLGRGGGGTLEVRNDGSVRGDFTSVHLGDADTAVGGALLSAAGHLQGLDTLFIGESGSGLLDISGASEADNRDTFMAAATAAVGQASVAGAGSSWTMSGGLTVGDGGSATVSIASGGAVVSHDGYLGATSTAFGAVTVDGTGSSWTLNADSGQLGVGSGGTGTLAITNGGAVSTFETFIGDGMGAVGTLSVSGNNSSFNSTGELNVGFLGTGSLLISDGGAVVSGEAFIAAGASAIGNAIVGGPGASWHNIGTLHVGTAGGAGTLVVNSGALVQADAMIEVGAAGTVLYNGGTLVTERLNLLGGGANVIVSAGGDKLVQVQTLSIGATGGTKLDLNDNDLIVDYPDAAASPLAQLRGWIAQGRHGGAWDGSGITSTSAKIQANHATTLGILSSTEYKSIYGSSATFDGQAIDNSAVLVKYTWYGDSDFNGRVNFDDYVRIDNGFNNHLSGWLNGDFDGNGQVNFDDYVLIDLAFNTQSGTLRRAVSFLDGADVQADTNDPALRRVKDHFEHFGSEYAQHFLSAVPETAMLNLGGLIMLACRRRRSRRPGARMGCHDTGPARVARR